jgi:hypothetical protein
MDENVKLILVAIIVAIAITMTCNYCKKEKNKK